MLKVGEKVEDFCLQNQDGVEICLRDLSGKWLVIYFTLRQVLLDVRPKRVTLQMLYRNLPIWMPLSLGSVQTVSKN